MPAINKLYRDYQDRASFYFVYIEEAHAHDVWPLVTNAKEEILFGTHNDAEERANIANTCATALKIEFPMLVDDMKNGAGDA